MKSSQPSKTLHRFFAGVAEQTFQSRLGVADPPLIDYISDLLIRFIRFDTVISIRNLSGRPVEEIGRMLAEAEARIGLARREVHCHIGDFTLFWTGVYPESLRARQQAEVDRYGAYCASGKRSYYIASTIETDREEDASAEVLQRLSDQFEMCAYGLREARRQWEGCDDDESRDLLIN